MLRDISVSGDSINWIELLDLSMMVMFRVWFLQLWTAKIESVPSFQNVTWRLSFSEVSGEEIVEEKGRGKAKEHCENPGSVKEDNQSVWQGKPEQCENLNKEDSEKVWQLEKEAADAIARAAAAVSGEIEDDAL